MTDKARQLLERCLEHLEWVTQFPEGDDMEEVAEEIRAYLAEPARKPMTKEEIARGFYSGRWLYEDFEAGIRFAEKHHGIGGGE